MLLLFTGFTIPVIYGTAAGSNAPQTGVAVGTFVPAPEVIMMVLPIQNVVALNLPIGQTPPVIVPPWALV